MLNTFHGIVRQTRRRTLWCSPVSPDLRLTLDMCVCVCVCVFVRAYVCLPVLCAGVCSCVNFLYSNM